jgi:hypothetical protein
VGISGTDPQPGIQFADIGDLRTVGLEGGGALLVAAAREAGKTFFAQ